MSEPQQQQIQIEAVAHALMNALIDFDEENFRFILMSGGPARMYVAGPKHAKRIKLLLDRQIEAYEKKFGAIKTELPKAQRGTKDEELGFKV